MAGLYVVYGVLIAAALVIVPFRIRARRRTLREIDNLSRTLHSSTQALIGLVGTSGTDRERRSTKTRVACPWSSKLTELLDIDTGSVHFIPVARGWTVEEWQSADDWWLLMQHHESSHEALRLSSALWQEEAESRHRQDLPRKWQARSHRARSPSLA